MSRGVLCKVKLCEGRLSIILLSARQDRPVCSVSPMHLPFLPSKPVLPIPAESNPLPAIVPKLPSLLDLVPIKFPKYNVVTRFAHQLGLETAEYPPVKLSMTQFIDESLRFALDAAVLTTIVYMVHLITARAPPAVRRVGAFGAAGVVLFWPLLVGTGESALLNFLRPGIGFRSALLAWDILQIRTVEEVQSWSLIEFVGYLCFFPVEKEVLEEREKREGFKRNARLQCLKQFPTALCQLFFASVFLLFIPPREHVNEISSVVYCVYSILMGVEVFLILSSLGLLVMNLFGLLVGMEQEPMFQNPFFTTRLRYFWSRWNRAIATVLHRVIFGGRKTYKTLEERRAEEARTAENSGASSAVDAKATTLRQRKSGSVAPTRQPTDAPPAPRRRSSFVKKSMLALLTFLVSGLFHEYLVFFAAPYHFGCETAFFVLNGLGTVLSSGLERFFPKINNKIPGWVRYIAMVSFYASVGYLFFAPFIEANFFANFQHLIFAALPSDMAKPRPMFVYVFGK